jgi:hypothetical protein
LLGACVADVLKITGSLLGEELNCFNCFGLKLL